MSSVGTPGGSQTTRGRGLRDSLLVPLAAILILAAVLQFSQLGAKSLWYDETVTVRIASEPDLDHVIAAYRESERQPPLHYLMLHGWVRLFGDGDASVRVPSALLSVVSVALLFWLGLRLVGRGGGLLAAYLLAISPLLLLFGRMARYYSLGLFLALLSTVLLVEALSSSKASRRSKVLWGLYSAATIVFLLTNYADGALYLSQVLFVGILLFSLRGRRSVGETLFDPSALRAARMRWLVSQAFVFAALGAWFAYDWGRIAAFGRPLREFDVGGWKALALNIFYPLYAFGLGQTIFPWHPLALLVVVVLAVVTVLGLMRLHRLGRWGWLPAVGFAGTLLFTLVAFQFFVRDLPFVTLPARAISALPFFLLVVALGLAHLKDPLRALVLVTLTAASAFAAWNYFTGRDFHNPIYAVPAREIVRMVTHEARPSDLIVADVDSGVDYYYRPEQAGPELLSAQDSSRVKATLQSGEHDRVWLITLGRDGSRQLAPVDLEAWISQHFRLDRSWGYVPQDPLYRRIKESIQGFEGYRYKATVRLFEP